jgi:hypothetical protein
MIFLLIPLLIHFLGEVKAPEYLTRSLTKKGSDEKDK